MESDRRPAVSTERSATWSLRVRLFLLRFWQPTSACLTCMPGSFANVVSVPHWEIALRTGLTTGALVVLLTFTPLVRLFGNRWSNAAVVGCLTAIGDACSHVDHYGHAGVEAIVTGCVSALFSLVASFVFEDRARRLRHAWGRFRA